ncbi:MAG: response regulator [Ignavibacteriae bacterium]|nr:response regulator [Ignavibacteriota bacterium]
MKSKILIIEDDLVLSNNLSTLLIEEGFEVFHAENGEIGILKAIKDQPDLIICDIMMTGIDGFEVKKVLNENENTFDIPLIFLTAKAEIADLRKGMDLGAEDYLFKPYKAEELLEIINLRIEKKRKIIAKVVDKQTTEFGSSQSKDSIFVNIGTEYKIIKFTSIKAILASNQYSNILLDNNKTILIRKSLGEWEKILPKRIFMRIHRSTIINTDFITRIEKFNTNMLKVFLQNDEEPYLISRRNASNLKAKF